MNNCVAALIPQNPKTPHVKTIYIDKKISLKEELFKRSSSRYSSLPFVGSGRRSLFLRAAFSSPYLASS